MKMASKWIPLKTVSRRVKEVILRTIGQLIKSQNLTDIKSQLLSLFIVLTNETDGFDKITGIETPCEMHKRKLISYSSSGNNYHSRYPISFIFNLIKINEFFQFKVS